MHMYHKKVESLFSLACNVIHHLSVSRELDRFAALIQGRF